MEIKFRMLSAEELAAWVVDNVPELAQEDINGTMTMYAFLSDFDVFMTEVPEASELYSEWLEAPSMTELH